MSKEKNIHINNLFKILDIRNIEDLKRISKLIGVNINDLEYYNNNLIVPNGKDLIKIENHLGCSELEVKLRLGILDNDIIEWIANNPKVVLNSYKLKDDHSNNPTCKEVFSTGFGKLYQEDCIQLMKSIESESVNLIFADPPFNLGKQYESGMNDLLSERDYLLWTEKWILECIRILAPGGSIFIYNIPYWQTYISNILNKYLDFRHWIAIYMRGLIPVPRKLNPSHYGLLYYTKGDKPKVFNKQRIPMNTCRHCGGEIHDYGGKKKDLDPNGLSIADVWTDINPVRHKKFKNRDSNELPLKLLYRVIMLASNEGDLIFDPFGGSGTTYAVAEYLNRRWIGTEIGSVDPIIDRLNNNKQDHDLLKKIQSESNVLFTKDQVKLRLRNNLWGYEKLNKEKE